MGSHEGHLPWPTGQASSQSVMHVLSLGKQPPLSLSLSLPDPPRLSPVAHCRPLLGVSLCHNPRETNDGSLGQSQAHTPNEDDLMCRVWLLSGAVLWCLL